MQDPVKTQIHHVGHCTWIPYASCRAASVWGRWCPVSYTFSVVSLFHGLSIKNYGTFWPRTQSDITWIFQALFLQNETVRTVWRGFQPGQRTEQNQECEITSSCLPPGLWCAHLNYVFKMSLSLQCIIVFISKRSISFRVGKKIPILPLVNQMGERDI